MDLRVIDRSEAALTIEIGGEDHTFMNALKQSLLELESVDAATYDVNPEQSGGQTDPVLTIKTDGDDPLDVLSEATQSVGAKSEAFVEAYEAGT